jgi:allantoinase
MLTLRGQRVVTPSGVRAAAIHIDQGVIREVEFGDMPGATDFYILPGLVDAQVSIPEPSPEAAETFASTTQAAAAGGVTTIVDLPRQGTANLESWNAKRLAAEGHCWVDCGVWAGTADAREIGLLWRAGVFGFSAPAEATEETVTELARMGARWMAHLGARHSAANGHGRYADHLAAYPPAAEEREVEHAIQLARRTGVHVHLLGVSCEPSLDAIRRARAEGLPVTASTSPHYLFFTADDIPEGATALKCMPPIRERVHQDALWLALEEGILDVVNSDHTPSRAADKQGGFAAAQPGISALQLGLPVTWTARRPPIEQLVKWFCEMPARLAGLSGRKGKIAPGYDADFVVFNPQARWVLMPQDLFQLHKLSPYVGRQLQGRVEATYVRGVRVFQHGQFSAQPQGRWLQRVA